MRLRGRYRYSLLDTTVTNAYYQHPLLAPAFSTHYQHSLSVSSSPASNASTRCQNSLPAVINNHYQHSSPASVISTYCVSTHYPNLVPAFITSIRWRHSSTASQEKYAALRALFSHTDFVYNILSIFTQCLKSVVER